MSNDFLALGIRQEMVNHLKDLGFTEPTPVQTQAIPLLMAKKDLVAQSQTGTGKTLAFLLPILETIDLHKPFVQALIITPTRELALQITKETGKLADKLGLNVLSLYGGQPLDRQLHKLKGIPQIVIGTPGRLLDHLQRGTINLSKVSQLVLDEADQMLHMGFLEEVEAIIRKTPGSRQTILFSATIPSKIRSLADRYMKRPTDIRIRTQNVTLDEIEQIVVETSQEDKLDKLCKLLDEYRPYLTMVFCHTKQRVSLLNTALTQRGYEVDELHGDLSQNKREQVMRRFREAKLQILVVTDIAARGLDIEGITHVFNYDIPHDVESYIHRIGRTGRAGQAGTAVTFVTSGEHTYLRIIEHGIRASIKKNKPAPAAKAATAGINSLRRTVSSPPKKRSDKKVRVHGGINQRSRRKNKNSED